MASLNNVPSSGWQAILSGPFDTVLEHLDVESIKSLRLTSKAMSARCLTPRFKRCFVNISAETAPAAFSQLLDLVSHPVLGPCVKNLTLFAPVYDPTTLHLMIKTEHKHVLGWSGNVTYVSEKECTLDEIKEAKMELAWLQAKMTEQELEDVNLLTDLLTKAMAKLGHLERLSLNMLCIKGPHDVLIGGRAFDWAPVWLCAARTFRIATSAMATSHVRIDSLDVYGSVQRCSIQSIEITDQMNILGSGSSSAFSAVGHSIKEFSMNFSTRARIDPIHIIKCQRALNGIEDAFLHPWDPSRALYEGDESEISAPENFTGLPSMLRQMPNLESINLFQFQTVKTGSEGHVHVLSAIVGANVRLHSLKKVIFRGLRFLESDIVTFLQNHPSIDHLELHDVRLLKGLWSSVIDLLNHGMPSLRFVHLSALESPDRTILNLAPARGPPIEDMELLKTPRGRKRLQSYAFQTHDGGVLVYRRSFNAEDLACGIELTTHPQGARFGCPDLMKFLRQRHLDYGPP
jgi:hypothetical protein